MTIFTTAHKPRSSIRLWSVVFWLAAWQLGSMALDQTLLLASPLQVAVRLWQLLPTGEFWWAVGFSAGRILGGFLMSCGAAVVCGALSARFVRVRELIAPLVAAVKATPVASFIIVALIWVPARNLSLLISCLMAFAPLYLNLLEGIGQRDAQLLEMARVFRVPLSRRLRGIDIPAVLPYFRAASSLALGLCWKSGIAAEVIGLPGGSLGERLYTAKIYFETPDLFAWTVAIVAAAVVFERLFLAAVTWAVRKTGGGA